MQIPTYKLETIMKAIRKEGLADNAYCFKIPSIVYVYTDTHWFAVGLYTDMTNRFEEQLYNRLDAKMHVKRL